MKKEGKINVTGLINEGDEFLVKLGENSIGKLRIISDPCPDEPREFAEFPTRMYCWHSRYRLGDKHSYPHSSDFLEEMVSKHIPKAKLTEDVEDLSVREMVHLLQDSDDFLLVPIFMYEHSGITISTSPFSDRWDSGQVGWISIDKETALKNYSVTEKNWKNLCQKIMEEEIGEYNDYLVGDVYGYKLYAADEYEEPNSEIVSVWNFYGDRYEKSSILDDFEILEQIA